MQKVRIKNGIYGHRVDDSNRVRPVPVGGVVDVSDAEAARLVALKVAERVTSEAVEKDDDNIKDDENGKGNDNNALYIALCIENGHYTAESLMTLTRPELDKMAAEFELDVSKCKNKSEVAALIAEIEVAGEDETTDSEEQPPELSASSPVI